MSGPPDWLIRPVRAGDTDALVALAAALGPGMTALPADADAIAAKIDRSVRTFAGQDVADSQYILVLEDRPSGQVLGLSGVYLRVGEAHGFFSYKLTRLIQRSVDLGRRYEIELLTLSNDYTGATEVGTLAVLPGLQGSGAGRFLARARYMLIGAFPTSSRRASWPRCAAGRMRTDRGHSGTRSAPASSGWISRRRIG